MITTTLNKLRAFKPCKEGWEKFLRFKGKTQADDEEFPLVDVLTSNGLHDTIWALRVAPHTARLFARACLMRAQKSNYTAAANAAVFAAVYAAYTAADAYTAAAAAYTAAAAAAADDAAYTAAAAAAADDDDDAAARQWQFNYLRDLLTNTNT